MSDKTASKDERRKNLAAKAEKEMMEDAAANIAGSVMGAVAGLSGGGPVVAGVVHEQVTGAIAQTSEEARKKKKGK